MPNITNRQRSVIGQALAYCILHINRGDDTSAETYFRRLAALLGLDHLLI